MATATIGPVSDEESKELNDLLRKSSQYKDFENLPPYSNITILDLGNCSLSSLPTSMPEVLPNMKVLFLSNNHFFEMPPIISIFQKLDMIAFKGNQMTSIHPDCFIPNTKLRWIILTNNCITEIPDTIGNCSQLQKFMLSGNRLTSLPTTISKCTELELIRLACNQLSEPPMDLLQLPKLKWVALGGNTFLETAAPKHETTETNGSSKIFHDLDVTIGTILGRGASGITRAIEIPTSSIYDSSTNDVSLMTVAVKTYHSEITSDGTPELERQIALFVSQIQQRQLTCGNTSSTRTNMIPVESSKSGFIHVYGQCGNTSSLVMEYLHNFNTIADPPSFESCTRDVYNQNSNDKKWSPNDTIQFVNVILYSLQLLHQHGITHGDLYGHNVLVSFGNNTTDGDDGSSGACMNVRLSDFGASFIYDTKAEYGKRIEMIEIRAFQVMLEELMTFCFDDSCSDEFSNKALLLSNLISQCNTASTFCGLYIYWQQQLLKDMARAFDTENSDD